MLTAVADSPTDSPTDSTTAIPEPSDSIARTTVLVFAKDPISRAGVASQLLGAPDVDVIERGAAQSPDVAVLVADVV
ncbi:MAG TPA: hypothetical protein VLL25_02385, partial [Acidimicrobiales bacterium]|nr:hypothetical protein [Acidimicrobiales bacterium]